ncbi:hypothetical protein ACSBOB_20080 [Mesorhizobium sp. ASY16-5R]|uniref:hypothetical protein n=1 Tax=Mesorhizobium sp. ASY16-5R TaxID=3445772 RepID=UPI003F9FD4A9
MQVDHILPESLLDDPNRLTDVLTQFSLPPTFEINSVENWLPACGRCNQTKRETVFEPVPIIQLYLMRAKAKSDDVNQLIREMVDEAQVAKAFGVIERAVEGKTVESRTLIPLINSVIQKLGMGTLDSFSLRDPDDDIIALVVKGMESVRKPRRYAVPIADGLTLHFRI